LKHLVDANILSEMTKPQPAEEVINWLRHNESEIAIDPVILGEIRFGILLLPSSQRRRKLEAWFEQVVETIHCLPWDSATGLRWAGLLADLRAKGRSMPVKDSMIAATALVHGLTVATRNLKDFSSTGLKAVDPFAGE
jgi:predicted nucleic acid-binding protein